MKYDTGLNRPMIKTAIIEINCRTGFAFFLKNSADHAVTATKLQEILLVSGKSGNYIQNVPCPFYSPGSTASLPS